jgi:hypothetical protein
MTRGVPVACADTRSRPDSCGAILSAWPAQRIVAACERRRYGPADGAALGHLEPPGLGLAGTLRAGPPDVVRRGAGFSGRYELGPG